MLDALPVLALGFGLGISLAAPPGPIAVVSAERAAHHGLWPSAVVSLGATCGDGTYALAMGFGLIPLVAERPLVLAALTVAGAFLMFFFALGAWRTARRPPRKIGEEAPEKARGLDRLGLVPGGFAIGYTLAITSPYNLGWWLGAGTALFSDYGILVFVGFFFALLVYSFVWAALFVWASARAKSVVAGVSYAGALLLAAFGVLLLHKGVTAFVAMLI